MAIKLLDNTAKVFSIHDEEEPVRFFIPNVIPGSYIVPGISAPSEQFDLCRFSLGFDPAHEKRVNYAAVRTIRDTKLRYTEITIFEAVTMVTGTMEQKFDEHNRILFPDVQRVQVPVRAERVANEIERQFGFQGLMASGNSELTTAEYLQLRDRMVRWMRHNIQETTKWAKRSALNVTPQSLRQAYWLYKEKLIGTLPDWAVLNPEGKMESDQFNCEGCGAVLPKTIIKCLQCGAVYNWKRAIDLGIVAPQNVPLHKRAEAGLLVIELPPAEAGAADSRLSAGAPSTQK